MLGSEADSAATGWRPHRLTSRRVIFLPLCSPKWGEFSWVGYLQPGVLPKSSPRPYGYDEGWDPGALKSADKLGQGQA